MPKTPYSELIKGNPYITKSFVESYTVTVDEESEIRFTHNGDGTILMECKVGNDVTFSCTLTRDGQQALRLGMSSSITTNENGG